MPFLEGALRGDESSGFQVVEPLAEHAALVHVRLGGEIAAVQAIGRCGEGADEALELGIPAEVAGEYALVFRDGLDVQALQISAGAWTLLTRLQTGDSLAYAAAAAADADPQFDLAGTIALLLRHPLVTRMEPLP